MFYVKFFWRFLKVVEMFIDAVSDKKCLKLLFKGQIKSVILQYEFTSSITFSYILFLFFHKNTALKHKSVKMKNMGTYFIVAYVKNPVRNWMTCENIFLSVLESLVDLSEIWYLFEPKIRLLFFLQKGIIYYLSFSVPCQNTKLFSLKKSWTTFNLTRQ